MTESEKILARACGRKTVIPDEIIEAEIDCAMIHDNNAHLVIKQFEKIRNAEVLRPDKINFFIDHNTPSTTETAAANHLKMRNFAGKHRIKSFFDCGEGISHINMLEKGIAGPGKVIVGTDSHTTGEGAAGGFAVGIGASEMAAVLATDKIWLRVPKTIRIDISGDLGRGVGARDVINMLLAEFGPSGADYCSVEFGGSTVAGFDLYERAVLCLMGAEMGAKNVIISDNEAGSEEYFMYRNYEITDLEPLAACPDLPTNSKKIRELERERILINQAAIASCAGAGLRDLEISSRILDGKKVAENVRLIVSPATKKIFNESLERGYIQKLHEAGAVICSPSCGVCGGYAMGNLAPGEVCISSTTRNMPGRMGKGGIVYLSGAASVAASSINGYISDPRNFL